MSLKDAFMGIRESKTQTRRARSPKTKPVPVKSKSRNPDYSAVKVYVRTESRRQAERKYQDAGGRDLSDLFEELLQSYLKA